MNVELLLSLSAVAALGTVGTHYIFAQTVNADVAQPALAYPQVPESIQVSEGQPLLFAVAAQGDQIYICEAKADDSADDSGEFEWTLKAPQAGLFDQQGRLIGRHYGGPTWELNDGSKIVGQLKTKVDAPQMNAVPWLLLEVRSHAGEGMFNQVNWVQRIHTVGGKAPASGCDQMHQNQEVRVGYSADYYFYGQE